MAGRRALRCGAEAIALKQTGRLRAHLLRLQARCVKIYLDSHSKERSECMRLVKMHGIGNDYVFADCIKEKMENPAELAVRISDRHFGVGSDGLILICPSERADYEMPGI